MTPGETAERSIDDLLDFIAGKRKRPSRKKATTEQRLTPCQWCAHPLSQRHHIFPINRYGENEFTFQLCANCHEIYHIVYDMVVKRRPSAIQKFDWLVQTLGIDNRALGRACHVVNIIYHHELGDYDEWIAHIKQRATDDANQ